MENPATLAHVVGTIERPLTEDEKRVIPDWLERAWRELNRVVPGISQRNALSLAHEQYLATEDVRDVVVAMVERKVRNADARRKWSADDVNEEVDSSIASGQLYVSSAEKAGLMPRFAETGGLYSIPLTTR
jgi:hypothetical protein